MMIVSIVIIVSFTFIISFIFGYLVGVRTSPKVFKKELDKIFEDFQSKLEAETRRQEALQKQITEQYQKAVQDAIYEHMMATGETPSREEMN